MDKLILNKGMPDNDLRYRTSRPYTRWWWFSNDIKKDDIKYQLDWLKKNNFGGVEIAWVYPQPGQPRGPAWLSREWSDLVAFAKKYCDDIGLGCDFTFGTLWPFGGTLVGPEYATKTYTGLSPQRLDRSWEEPEKGLILNHLDRCALEKYADGMGRGLQSALSGSKSALLCDSWEVAAENLWTDGFDRKFMEVFGYDIKNFMPEIDRHPDARYDYRKLIGDYVLNEFYRPFTEVCRRIGGFARVQCHGAPTDVLAAFAAADVPESEAILFDPDFSRIPASAAALTGKPVVSAEAFTCLYGWIPYPGPGPHQKQERLADIKLLADALIANGVNQIFWHGMPFNPAAGNNQFYASIHVGPDSPFAGRLADFNEYLTRACSIMRRGVNHSDLAVYLPLEDMRMLGELPENTKKPSAVHYWEMHTVKPPEGLKGYHPLWISLPFLMNSRYENGVWLCGGTQFKALYLDVEWLDRAALAEILRLAKQGLPVCLIRKPAQPGRIKSERYERELDVLRSQANVADRLDRMNFLKPLVAGDDLPDFWCRDDGEVRYIFFAHPEARGLTYPLRFGQAEAASAAIINVTIAAGRDSIPVCLKFGPGQSRLVKCTRTAVESIDL